MITCCFNPLNTQKITMHQFITYISCCLNETIASPLAPYLVPQFKDLVASLNPCNIRVYWLHLLKRNISMTPRIPFENKGEMAKKSLMGAYITLLMGRLV